MSNKRLPELSELLYTQVAGDDLFLISDMSAVESKKITANSLRQYVSSTGSYSGSFYGTSSYATTSDTASFLRYTGQYNGSSSYAISSSYALSASRSERTMTASFSHTVTSASYSLSSSWAFQAVTASYAITSSIQLVVSSGFAEYCNTASYLLYQAGFDNGTASSAISSSWAESSQNSSYLVYTAGASNGTSSYSVSSSNAISASFLKYTGAFNGSSSYAVRSGTTLLANTSSVALTSHNDRIYRDFDTVTSSISDGHTASFGWLQITSSGTTPRAIIRAWGDVCIPISGISTLRLEVSSSSGTYLLDNATFKNFIPADTGAIGTTASIQSFLLEGQFTVNPTPLRFSASVMAYNGLTFYTGSRAVQSIVKTTSDYFLDE